MLKEKWKIKWKILKKNLELQDKLNEIENLLYNSLKVDSTIDWESLKQKGKYENVKPIEPVRTKYKNIPEKPDKNLPIFAPDFNDLDKLIKDKPKEPSKKEYKEDPAKPFKYAPEFQPNFTLVEEVLLFKKQKKINEFNERYLKAIAEWQKKKNEIDNYNKDVDLKFANDFKKWKKNIKKWESKCESIKQESIKKTNEDYENAIKIWEDNKIQIEKYNTSIDTTYENKLEKWKKDLAVWESEKDQYYKKQKDYNLKVNRMKKAYLKKDLNAINDYCKNVLDNSKYPKGFSKDYKLEYNPENEMLLIEFQLPAPENLPKIEEVKYIASKKELKKIPIPKSQFNQMYDDALYKITLRTLHELFKADIADAIAQISFNGWVKSLNESTGKKQNSCIISIQVTKAEFKKLSLKKVDPKSCFKQLKGVAGSKLMALIPIQPILQLNKKDKRFIDAYDIANKLDNTTNIAAMDWGDFEHLIREIFEKEFSVTGGEVKVTQASRDGGVDAIAFDPDPLRGGKIVIQAKRYTNTVGVSAVRDLYGTVVNEGATKGILVSTADYGPDAYDFAKGKPLTLLNGSNLLHLLEKHGHHAKIDLKEAKRIIAENIKNEKQP